MNYLDLVNNVLRRMREDTVSAVNENVMSSLVGDFVNDAKRQVEDSWDWSALRTTIQIPTVQGTSQYSITGSQNRATIISVMNRTQKCFMQPRSQDWGRLESLTTAGEGVPYWYVTNEPDTAGDTQVTLYSTPDAIYLIDFAVVLRTTDLSAEGDTISIPHQPVIQLAYAMSLRETGEAGGTTTPEQFLLSNKILADAIAQDSALNPTDMIWYYV